MAKELKKVEVVNVLTGEVSYTTNLEWLKGQDTWVAKGEYGDFQVVDLAKKLVDKLVELKTRVNAGAKADELTQYITEKLVTA